LVFSQLLAADTARFQLVVKSAVQTFLGFV